MGYELNNYLIARKLPHVEKPGVSISGPIRLFRFLAISCYSPRRALLPRGPGCESVKLMFPHAKPAW